MTYLIQLNQLLWSGPILILLMGIHLYHTFRFHFIQRKTGRGIRLSLSDDPSEIKSGFGRFGSLTTTLAATLGTGNIIGISTAVYLGGPGAVFWCWITGIFGMATTYAETRLCCRYRFQEKNGICRSGPMYLLKYLLNRPVMAVLYSTALCCSAFFIGCTTQSNAISETASQVFGIPPFVSALFAAVAAGFILIRGRARIEKFSIALVPSMAFFFLGGCLLYLILHASFILPAAKEIFFSAFRPSCAGAGIAGFSVGRAIRYGVARGLFTNEAGLGTAGLVAGNSAESDDGKQALISMTASFWDTVVLCAVTGLVLVAFLLEYPDEYRLLSAGSLTAGAFSRLPFFGDEILSLAIFSFALATLVGWSYLGMQGYHFLFSGRYQKLYYTVYIGMIFIGGILPLSLVWELTDFFNLFLLIPSVYMLIRCRKYF